MSVHFEATGWLHMLAHGEWRPISFCGATSHQTGLTGFGFKRVGAFTGIGRKFGRYWHAAWNDRPGKLD
jgi:hypothetical protein